MADFISSRAHQAELDRAVQIAVDKVLDCLLLATLVFGGATLILVVLCCRREILEGRRTRPARTGAVSASSPVARVAVPGAPRPAPAGHRSSAGLMGRLVARLNAPWGRPHQALAPGAQSPARSPGTGCPNGARVLLASRFTERPSL